MSCWVYISDSSKTLAVFSKRGTFGPFEYSLDNHFNHSVFNLDNWIEKGSTTVYGIDPLKASITVLLNSWHHIAFVADSLTLKVYFDGYLQSGIDTRILHKSLTHTFAHFVIGNG